MTADDDMDAVDAMEATDITDGDELGQDADLSTNSDEISLVPMANMDVDDGDQQDDEDKVEGDQEVQNEPEIQVEYDGLEQTGDVSMESPPNSHHSAAAQQQLHPIEVVISPPRDPYSYNKIELPPSWYVLKILEKFDVDEEDDYGYGQDTWYSVEFDDGRIDQVSVGICLRIPLNFSRPKRNAQRFPLSLPLVRPI